MAMMCKALFAARSPPRLSRCRIVLPDDAGTGSAAPHLIGTPRKRTISAREVDHGQGHDYWKAAGRRGATARVRRSGARARREDVAPAEDGGGAATAAGRGPGRGFAVARCDSCDARRL